MKHFFFSALIAFTLISCSDNDSSNTNTGDNSLVGTRQLSETSLNDEDFTLSACEQLNTVQFTDAGLAIFTYNLASNSSNCHIDAIETGDYTKAGNNITITWDESDEGHEVYHLTVTELSGSTLKWKTTITGEGELKEAYTKQ